MQFTLKNAFLIKRKAFTLAEVLITLGIIGIVAALILPTFIKNYKQRAYNQHAQVFIQKLTESTKLMNLRDDLTPHSNTNDFVNIFKKYIKIVKICNTDKLENCFAKEINVGGEIIDISELSTSENFGKKTYSTGNIGLIFVDGLSVILSYNPECPSIDPYNSKGFNTSSCLSYILDVNGIKRPNKIGQDIITNGVEVTLKKKNEYIDVACAPFAGYGACPKATVSVDIADSVAGEFLGSNNGGRGDENYLAASPNGAQMSWGLANKTCKDKGMRLPLASELHNMYEASKRGEIAAFNPANYWALGGWGGGSQHNCNMSGGNCGDSSTSYLQYVRCVAP